MKKERSRTYPVLDLETAYRILVGKLSRLGSERLDRDALAEMLGYSSAGGGIAARKVSALVQYGLLDYRDGFYELSSRGHRLQGFKAGTEDFLSAVRAALEKPGLFRSILSRYRPQGRIPEDLARVLTEHYGITERASEDAERVFIQSAIFSEVLDVRGCFLETSLRPAFPARALAPPSEPRIEVSSSHEPSKPPKGYPFPLVGERAAKLKFPPQMTVKDLEILEEELRAAIQKGRLWCYLGLEKPAVVPAQVSAEKPEPSETDNVVPIRSHKES